MLRLLHVFSARKPAPQPPSEPHEPTLELESGTPATAISTTNRKRKVSDAVSTDCDSSSPSQRPAAQRRRLVAGDQLFPQKHSGEGSCPSEDGQPETQLLIPNPTASSPLAVPRPESTWAPKPNASTTVDTKADTIQATENRSPAKLKARPAPTSDSEADGHGTQSNTDDDKPILPRKTRLSVDLSTPTPTPTPTNDQIAISFDDTETRYDFASQSPPSHTQATVRSPVARRGRPPKTPQEELTGDQSDSESNEDVPVNIGVRQRTPGEDEERSDNAFESSRLVSPQKSNNKDDEEQDGQLEDDNGQVAIIESNSNPEVIPIILNEDVTDKKFTISSIIDHRRDADIDHAFELSVRWVNFAKPSWESERSIQAQVPDLLYKYWESVGGRPVTGAFRVFSVLRHWSTRPPRVGTRGPQPKRRTKYLVQWEGYSADPQHTSVETREKLRDIAPRELDLYLEHVSAKQRAALGGQVI
ncbi:hypothetical protein RB595_001148 [Gaeumannomyces hyphopodioides]